ncbi:NADPH-dependent FMN reductase [Virgibacillus siamensis]|uniref:NADPH-dependent FMN reductase n=1 Tax=Virgibacillus siamensis TaxID=480071 RepID=UPI000986EB41|nr:NADPH-dependent FMN reductase [Virgibacillus siamensis]
MGEIVVLSGSPSAASRSDSVLRYMGDLLIQKHFTVSHLSVRDLPYEDLFTGNWESPAIRDIALMIRNASGVIVGSPVYKGAYSGVLKALLDVLPRDVLQHTPVLPVMTGGSASHLLAIEYTLKPVLATLKGHNLKGLYLLDDQIDKHRNNPIIEDAILERTEKQLYYFADLVKGTVVWN